MNQEINNSTQPEEQRYISSHEQAQERMYKATQSVRRFMWKLAEERKRRHEELLK
jgi:hypothetical protein